MFIQIIQGRCRRADELHALLDEWRQDLAPGAKGWLGGTYGMTDDDMFVGVVRFGSREAAMANSARPEQDAWARKMMALMDGPLEYHDCDDVSLMMDGGSDDAGFVQVIQGKVDDPEYVKAMMTTDTETLHRMRPDIIGATLAIEDDGTFTETVAFTSEAEAREGEKKTMDMPPGEREAFEKMMQSARFYDLHQPWFASA